jgi:3-isopropylmalate/(R)-2-methylmalate dehydratase small subunit
MDAFTTLDAVAAPLPMPNIDTDQIIPAQFLKTVERQGLGRGLFFAFRFDDAGEPRPDFVLNRPEYAGAGVLVAGDNFGCGSSREHAPWALMDFGVRCVISTSFADIFNNNCFQNGLLPVALKADEVQALMDEAKGGNHKVAIDLAAQTVTSPSGKVFRFDIDPVAKEKMLKGLDAIGETLQDASAIDRFEAQQRTF